MVCSSRPLVENAGLDPNIWYDTKGYKWRDGASDFAKEMVRSDSDMATRGIHPRAVSERLALMDPKFKKFQVKLELNLILTLKQIRYKSYQQFLKSIEGADLNMVKDPTLPQGDGNLAKECPKRSSKEAAGTPGKKGRGKNLGLTQ